MGEFKMTVWRLNLKPGKNENLTYNDVLSFCQKKEIIGIGWAGITKTNDDWIIRDDIGRMYPTDKGCFKAINAMKNMQPRDLIWTRVNSIYYLCMVTDCLWKDCKVTSEHELHDIVNYVSVKWLEVGTEDKVPGKVINSFGPSATVQRVNAVENISKILWNKLTQNDFKYPINPFSIEDFWTSIDSEALECLILLYLQSKGYYIYSTTLKNSTRQIECVMVKNDGSHKCFPQVKRGNDLYGCHYENLLHNNVDKIFLFTTSQNYIRCNNPQIEYLTLNEVETFIEKNKNLLPLPVLSWVELIVSDK
jgi:hypothetical protein